MQNSVQPILKLEVNRCNLSGKYFGYTGIIASQYHFYDIEFSGLVLVVISAFPKIGSVNLFEGTGSGGWSVLMAASLGFFAFIGFEEIVKLAEGPKNPQKTIPKALFIASAIVTVMYFIVAVSAVSALPIERLSASSSPLSDITEEGLSSTAGLIIVIIALFSTSNTILSNMQSTSLFMKVSKRQTPYVALTLILVVMSAFALIGKIEVIAMIATCSPLHKSEPKKSRPFKVPLNINNLPVISFLGMAMTLLLFLINVYILIN